MKPSAGLPTLALAFGCLFVISACDSGLVASDGRIYPGGKYFGEHLALDGDRLLASAWGSNEASVLERETGGWTEREGFEPPSEVPKGKYGKAVALEGGVDLLPVI